MLPPAFLPTSGTPALCLALFLGVMHGAAAASQHREPTDERIQSRTSQERYGGMVVDQTLSVAGQDFYRHFSAAWREDPLSERFTLAVHEQASARWGSRVRVEYARRVIFQAALPVSRPAIPTLGRQAAQIVRQGIAEAEVDRLLLREADLAADEI